MRVCTSDHHSAELSVNERNHSQGKKGYPWGILSKSGLVSGGDCRCRKFWTELTLAVIMRLLNRLESMPISLILCDRLTSWAGKMKQILCNDWLTELSCTLGITRSVPLEKFPEGRSRSHIIYPLLTKMFGQDGWILAFFSLRVLDTVLVHKHEKKRTRPISIQPS